MDALLAGEHSILSVLRAQASACVVSNRRHTGVGSFTDIVVPDSIPRVSPSSLIIGDVDVEVSGVEHGQTTLLFVRDGALTMLEFAIYTGEWPTDPQAERIGYFRYVPSQSGGYSLVPNDGRDPGTLAIPLSGRA